MEETVFIGFVVDSVILIVLLASSRKSLERIRKVIDLLTSGGWKDCPRYVDQMECGRRWYDENHLPENKNTKGGENL